jgi:hypothetical protein
MNGLTAVARATFPPSGFTAMMPGISCWNIWVIAEPFALSSISFAKAPGLHAENYCTAFTVGTIKSLEGASPTTGSAHPLVVSSE